MQTLFRNRGTWNLTYIIFEKSFQCEKESIRGYLNVNVGQYCGHYKWEKQLESNHDVTHPQCPQSSFAPKPNSSI